MNHCQSLTKIVPLEDFGGSYHSYEAYLYSVFCNAIKNAQLNFLGKPLSTRRHPEYDGKEDSFFHLTCKVQYNLDDRTLDFRRSERLHWIPEVLNSSHLTCPTDCFVVYKKNKKLHFLDIQDRYIIVLDVRANYVLLVTAFYIEQEHTLRKKIKDYRDYLKNLGL